MYTLLQPEEIAENILVKCKEKKMSVQDLCKSRNIGENTVYNMRLRNSYPRIDTLFKIASGLGCTVDELCTRRTESACNEEVEA